MPLSSAHYRIGAVSAGGTHKDKKYILAEARLKEVIK